MHTIDQLLNRVDAEIEQLNLSQEPQLLYTPIAYTLATGGKRIRPVFVLLGCNMFCKEIEPAIDVAIAVEVFHNFTLLHDDIMDKAAMRRGKETVHVRWNENIAILSGDAMVIYAYSLLAKGGGAHLSRLIEVFNKFALEVCEGQQYDMDFETCDKVSEPDYLRMIELKTSVLLAGALQMGGIIGGASWGNCELLYQMGRNLGLAFQLQDDLLDTYGNPETFGKNIGGDIASNKKTFLLINALNRASAAEKEHLKALLTNQNLPIQDKIEQVKRIYQATGVKELTEQKITLYFNEALFILNQIEATAAQKKPLEEMAYWLMKRDR